ncbi:nucleoporin NUP35-like [Penaeus chinensis]|uniref:nucleoporin NUP35-like n=1 Tax=Penaeus chinensis TaxID=139456 RepID=UPI001FB75888|nr:nucleoporin NUP35-like [Penaeus chinensis]
MSGEVRWLQALSQKRVSIIDQFLRLITQFFLLVVPGVNTNSSLSSMMLQAELPPRGQTQHASHLHEGLVVSVDDARPVHRSEFGIGSLSRVKVTTFKIGHKLVGSETLLLRAIATIALCYFKSKYVSDERKQFGRTCNDFPLEHPLNSRSLCDALEDSWVTVFGFPAAAASYILTQFTQLGTIVEHRNPGTGNWMHLKYQTKLQARKALSKNGKVFSGNIMVGVVPCSDKAITGDKENMSANLSNVISPDSSMLGTPKSNMRPLTQAYQTAHAEHEVVPKVNTPKKNDSIVSKAMQHIFGL